MPDAAAPLANQAAPASGDRQTLARLTAEAVVRQTIHRFSDAVVRDDRAAFRALWAPGAVWEIGEPLPARAEGVDAICATLDRLMAGWSFFVQLLHGGVVEIDDAIGHAAARFEVREFARSEDGARSYDNFAVYDDALARGPDGRWRFTRRSYHYLWLGDAPITGRGFKLPPGLGRMPQPAISGLAGGPAGPPAG